MNPGLLHNIKDPYLEFKESLLNPCCHETLLHTSVGCFLFLDNLRNVFPCYEVIRKESDLHLHLSPSNMLSPFQHALTILMPMSALGKTFPSEWKDTVSPATGGYVITSGDK